MTEHEMVKDQPVRAAGRKDLTEFVASCRPGLEESRPRCGKAAKVAPAGEGGQVYRFAPGQLFGVV